MYYNSDDRVNTTTRTSVGWLDCDAHCSFQRSAGHPRNADHGRGRRCQRRSGIQPIGEEELVRRFLVTSPSTNIIKHSLLGEQQK